MYHIDTRVLIFAYFLLFFHEIDHPFLYFILTVCSYFRFLLVFILIFQYAMLLVSCKHEMVLIKKKNVNME